MILEDDPYDTRMDGFKNLFTSVGAVITWVDTAEECIEELKNDIFDIIFLDHDLGGEVFVDYRETNTGSEVSRWIYENPINDNTIVIIHSFNPVGGAYMNERISGSHLMPGAWTTGIGTIG